MNNILIIFNMFCSHATVILMTQCRQIYSVLYSIILLCAIFHIALVMAVSFAVSILI